MWIYCSNLSSLEAQGQSLLLLKLRLRATSTALAYSYFFLSWRICTPFDEWFAVVLSGMCDFCFKNYKSYAWTFTWTPERSQQLPSHNPSIEERDHTYHLGPHHDVCLWLEKEHHFTLNHEELTSRLTTINSCWSKACGKDKQWRQLGSQNSAWSRFSKASPRTWLTRETRASEISSSVMMTQHNSMEFHHWVGRRYLTWVYAGV